MRNQKIKTIVLSTLLGLTVASCKHEEDTPQRPQMPNKAKLEEQYKESIKDSIVRANGFPEGVSEFYRQFSAIGDSITALKEKNSPVYAMKTAVFAAGRKIAEHYAAILEKRLSNYDLTFDKELVAGAFSNPEFIMYGAYKDAGQLNSGNYLHDQQALDFEIERIVKSFNIEKPETEQEITKIVRAIILQMCKEEMYPSRKANEQQYAKFFPNGMNAINAGCIGYIEGECWAEYSQNELGNSAIVTERKVWVYDSKLELEQFQDATATYTIGNPRKGWWYIRKKDKNGHIYQTPDFQHTNAEDVIETRPVWDSVPKVGDKTFTAIGGERCGVHVNYTEVLAVMKPKSVFHGSPELDRMIRELQEKQHAYAEQFQNLTRIERYADSIAAQKTKIWVNSRTK